MSSDYLTDDPIDPAALIASVSRPEHGAVAYFAGMVRNHHQGKAVQSIDYQAYRPMAEKEMGRIVEAVRAKYPDVKISAVHRIGHLQIGDISIAIAASSPHRAESFAACREVIEQVKTRVPIWKKEFGPDGSWWVEGKEAVSY